MIIFENETSNDPQKIVTWDQVAFKDGKDSESPIKSLHLEVVAGGLLEMVVERYVMGGHFTLSEDGSSVPLTKKTRYCVLQSDEDLTFRVRANSKG